MSFEPLIGLFVTSLVKFILWCLFTAFGYRLLDWLTPILPFRTIVKDNPWIVVAILVTSGFAALKIVESFRIGSLL